jgi:uncharacterized repeat protein (TIGR01451 family)
MAMGVRLTRLKAALVAVCLAAGLLALGSSGVLATVTSQDGPVNYAGPGPCPTGTTDCLIATGDVDVVQTAPTTGSNTVDCRGNNCKATQGGSTDTARPTNVAACKNTTTAATSDQRCELHQLGTSNSITADLGAAPSTGGVVNLATVSQNSEQRFVTGQEGATNSLVVKGNINQQATSTVDATTPVNHNQRTLLQSQNAMIASSSNTADIAVARTQNSTATGATPTQLQDNAAGSETDGAVGGLGALTLAAKSAGTNAIKVRATDTKNQNATSLNLGQATQQQGHATGGWLVDLSGTDSGVANAGGAPDIDLGTPGTTDGVTKTWTQHAQGVLGGGIAKDQDQLDTIRIPIIGQSPFTVTSSAKNTLTTDDGGHQVCGASSVGHAKTNWTGKLACDMHAGAKAQTPSVSFSATDVNASIACEQNNDTCAGGTVKPVSHGHMAVRNVTLGGSYSGDDGPASTSAAPNDVVEYRSIFHNGGSAQATGSTLSASVPANTTFVSCSDSCTGPTAGAVTLQVKVNAGTVAGSSISNKATGDDAEESPFDSQTTTVTTTGPRARTVGIKIFGANSGKMPVAILTTPDFNAQTVIASTVCFGDPNDPPRPPTGRDCTVANDGTTATDVDNDGDLDLKMHFDTAETGIDPSDKTGCLSGYTTDGQYVEGCGPLPK